MYGKIQQQSGYIFEVILWLNFNVTEVEFLTLKKSIKNFSEFILSLLLENVKKEQDKHLRFEQDKKHWSASLLVHLGGLNNIQLEE